LRGVEGVREVGEAGVGYVLLLKTGRAHGGRCGPRIRGRRVCSFIVGGLWV
jgi:hypothetical protein